ncbi:MAG TPA: acetate/propionate family kinase [Chitinophagales bacterium]|nr:acetate/propionate family kinase [Chitinophagales bacterium]
MHILVVNCGSSSVKADIIEFPSQNSLHQLRIERIGKDATGTLNDEELSINISDNYEVVLRDALKHFLEEWKGPEISGVGHRVVHGGADYSQPVLIDEDVKKAIVKMMTLVPLHNPVNLKGIEVCEEIFPELVQVAVFDTAFHRTIPNRAQYYAIDKDLSDEKNIRRYGFHGTSHQYVSEVGAKFLDRDIRDLKMITCHLGNGCSMTAVEYGRSVETSMGMSALEGLVMGTRSGDLDPGVMTYLLSEGYTPHQLAELLNHKSGLLGISGSTNDMRGIIQGAEKGDDRCRLALQIFTHRIRKYIGAYVASMAGVDVIVFTAGIGENSPVVRHRALQRFDFLGAIFDEDLNRDVRLTDENPVAEISAPNSRVKLLVVKTDEQKAIAIETEKIISKKFKVNTTPNIPIAISARHVHLRQETVELLFGKGHQLTPRSPLSQPGQFASEELVTLVGPKNNIERVRVLGPARKYDQVEVARTDEFFLGVDAPVRESGHIQGTPGITLIGPEGTVTLKEGLICALRHIHMHPDDAKVFGVSDQDIVEVDVENEFRPITFKNVVVRVSDQFKLEMHIDTDEGNAAEISNGQTGTLDLTGATCKLRKRNV